MYLGILPNILELLIVAEDIAGDIFKYLTCVLLVICELGDIALDIGYILLPRGYGLITANQVLPFSLAILTGLVLVNPVQPIVFTCSANLSEEHLMVLLKLVSDQPCGTLTLFTKGCVNINIIICNIYIVLYC